MPHASVSHLPLEGEVAERSEAGGGERSRRRPPPRPPAVADPPPPGEGGGETCAPSRVDFRARCAAEKSSRRSHELSAGGRSPVFGSLLFHQPSPGRRLAARLRLLLRRQPGLRADARGSLGDAGIEQLFQMRRDRRQRLARRLGARRARRVLAFPRVGDFAMGGIWVARRWMSRRTDRLSHLPQGQNRARFTAASRTRAGTTRNPVLG